jgi:hypothetical protein
MATNGLFVLSRKLLLLKVSVRFELKYQVMVLISWYTHFQQIILNTSRNTLPDTTSFCLFLIHFDCKTIIRQIWSRLFLQDEKCTFMWLNIYDWMLAIMHFSFPAHFPHKNFKHCISHEYILNVTDLEYTEMKEQIIRY